MTFFIIVIFLANFLLADQMHSNAKERSWYQIPYSSDNGILIQTKLALDRSIDYRGCYELFCLIISSSASSIEGIKLRKFLENEDVFVTQRGKVFFGMRPHEINQTEWITRVPRNSVRIPSARSFEVSREPNPLIEQLVSSVSEPRLKKTVEDLSDTFFTRNSYSQDSKEAAFWLITQFKNLGCKEVKFETFRDDMSPNVLCYKRSNMNSKLIVFGGHYDSRARLVNSKTERAPGADDNGSGSAIVLELAHLAHMHEFEYSLLFVLFSGEEQGLYGSEALANDIYREVEAMINVDMVGWEAIGDKDIVYFDRDRVTPQLRDLGRELVRTYLPHLSTGLAVGCCSDGDSFYSLGVSIASLFESASMKNPNYHKSSDLPSTLSFSRVRNYAQSVAALMGTIAIINE